MDIAATQPKTIQNVRCVVMGVMLHRSAQRVNEHLGGLCGRGPPEYPDDVGSTIHTGSKSLRPSDPRTAFLATIVVVVAALAIRDARAMAAILAVVCAWYGLVAGLRATARILFRLLPFAAIIVALNAVFVPGEVLWAIGGVRVVSREGVLDGAFFALRMAVMLVAVAAFVATSSPEGMARGAYDVIRRFSRDAAGRVALFVMLAMGFVPLVADEFARIRVAQSFRGGAFGGMRHRADVARAWMIPMLVSTIHRSNELAKTVELRRIRERIAGTIEAPRLRLSDVLLVAVVCATVFVATR